MKYVIPTIFSVVVFWLYSIGMGPDLHKYEIAVMCTVMVDCPADWQK